MKQEKLAPLCKHFYFLDYYLGKGLFLLLMASLILQHREMLQWLVSVALLVVISIDLIHGCLLGADPINSPPAWDSTKATTAAENNSKTTAINNIKKPAMKGSLTMKEANQQSVS